MAPTSITTPLSRTTSHNLSKSRHCLSLLALSIFFLVLVFSTRPMHGAEPSDTEIVRRSLPGSTGLSSSSAEVSAFHPNHFKTHHPSSRSEYEAGDHEVPSGPNPISNR
ncbi:hypothetical protein MLD38_021706 [Melastoma candidum]|uniref:Uncharacterized protein n=1 Tax=Melastoma candidum TaxID=119954 RepID=A0ACB9QGR8_9MYRT|nr:hypothetical protein MLD38_021706 [Melastoma candidum]